MLNAMNCLVISKFPAEDGEEQNLQVKPDAPVLDIIDIISNALRDRGVSPQTVDLRPSGYAGAYEMLEHVAGHLLLEAFDKEGDFGSRPDQAHIAFQHIPELGEFIQ